MRAGAQLKNARVAILGLGLMGGSLALALRGKCSLLAGMDRDAGTLEKAISLNVVDQASIDAGQILPQADLVILAMPVRAILSYLVNLPELHPGSPVVLDLGSTKNEITVSMERLPARFDPIGGHPMCGKEKSSLEYADASIYQGAPFALTPLPRTTRKARNLAEEMVQAIGAHPVWIDAGTHDRWVASTSHLPYLLACALAAATPQETAPLIGSGYRSTSRLAASSVEMMMDILETNREPVLAALDRFRSQIDFLQGALAHSQENRLGDWLAENSRRQANLLQETQKGA
jgi:prephenate dehydrogenase